MTMGGFAKKLRNKQKKHDRKNMEATYRTVDKATEQVAHADSRQVAMDLASTYEDMSNLTTIYLLSAHKVYGFGAKRLRFLKDKIVMHIRCVLGRLVTSDDIEKIVRNEAGFEIIKPEFDKTKWKGLEHRFYIHSKTTDLMMNCVGISLLDGYGFKGKRIAKIHRYANELNHKLFTEEKTMKDYENELKVVLNRGAK